MLIEADLTEETKYVIGNTPGVSGFVGPKNQPVPLDEKEVSNIEHRMGLLEKKPKPGIVFESGESIRIVQGPFTNFQGEIIEVNPHQQRLKVLVSIFGRETPVELEYVNVERL
jgi:transcriptional antiterminator NusG